MGDAHHRVGEEGAHHQTEDGEGAGVRARRGEGGRLGGRACLAHSALGLLPRVTRGLTLLCTEIDFRPENEPVNFDKKLASQPGITVRKTPGQSGPDMKIAVIRNTQYAIRNAF